MTSSSQRVRLGTQGSSPACSCMQNKSVTVWLCSPLIALYSRFLCKRACMFKAESSLTVGSSGRVRDQDVASWYPAVLTPIGCSTEVEVQRSSETVCQRSLTQTGGARKASIRKTKCCEHHAIKQERAVFKSLDERPNYDFEKTLPPCASR